MTTIHVIDTTSRSAAQAAIALTRPPFTVEIGGGCQSFQDWLDEVEVYSTRRERMIEDTQSGCMREVLKWARAAYNEGARNSVIGGGWQPIETAPTDGTEVELFTTCHGICQAWFALGEWSDDTPNGPAEYSGDAWVCCDDEFSIEVDLAEEFCDHGTATHWQPLPAPPND